MYLNKKKIISWIKKNKVIDVILFGSFVRDKSKPNDIDLCILIRDSQEKELLELADSLSKVVQTKGLNVQINVVTEQKFIQGATLSKTLIEEGLSIANNQKISKQLGYESKSLFTYSLKSFSPSKRVRFHYALNGRYGQKGILPRANAKIIGNGVIICDVTKEDLLKEVFDAWEVKYDARRILI